jgi:hypothetical protein
VNTLSGERRAASRRPKPMNWLPQPTTGSNAIAGDHHGVDEVTDYVTPSKRDRLRSGQKLAVRRGRVGSNLQTAAVDAVREIALDEGTDGRQLLEALGVRIERR